MQSGLDGYWYWVPGRLRALWGGDRPGHPDPISPHSNEHVECSASHSGGRDRIWVGREIGAGAGEGAVAGV